MSDFQLSYYVNRCHHGMARPRVEDGDGLQIWRVTAKILNRQGVVLRFGGGQVAKKFLP